MTLDDLAEIYGFEEDVISIVQQFPGDNFKLLRTIERSLLSKSSIDTLVITYILYLSPSQRLELRNALVTIKNLENNFLVRVCQDPRQALTLSPLAKIQLQQSINRLDQLEINLPQLTNTLGRITSTDHRFREQLRAVLRKEACVRAFGSKSRYYN